MIASVEIETTSRIVTFVRLDLVMPSLMIVPVTSGGKTFATDFTNEKPFTPVHPHVLDKVSSLVKFSVTWYP